MAEYAKIVDGKVENVIVADAEWIATQINDVYVESTNENTACVDGFYIDGRFTLPQPFSSWSLDDNNDWQPPVAKPNDENYYYWDEATLAWVATPAI